MRMHVTHKLFHSPMRRMSESLFLVLLRLLVFFFSHEIFEKNAYDVVSARFYFIDT